MRKKIKHITEMCRRLLDTLATEAVTCTVFIVRLSKFDTTVSRSRMKHECNRLCE